MPSKLLSFCSYDTMSLSLLPVSVLSLFLVCHAEAVQSALSGSPGGIALSVGKDSMCAWEKVSSESTYVTTLDRKSLLSILIF